MKRRHITLLHLSAWAMMLAGCASPGTPTGGPKDETPPHLIRTNPAENQINFNKKRIEVYFDELISLRNPTDKVIVSPPQKSAAIAKGLGNRALVILSDTLKPNTTYTIDFTDAIVDYNEGNPFGDYAFSFSTGDHIDSLRVSGYLLDASNLNPVTGVYIGSHSGTSDSLFSIEPFERISKTTKDGFFSLKGLPSGPMRIFALDDKNRDYRFDQPGEAIAFDDSIFSPYSEPCIKNDTVWKDSITVDTIIARTVTCFKPDNVILRLFTEAAKRQYLTKKERSPRSTIHLNFATKLRNLPALTLLNAPVGSKPDWHIFEKNETIDSLTYWITDTLVSEQDTLRFKLDYEKSDSLNQLVAWSDTFNLISRSPKPRPVKDTSLVDQPRRKKPSTSAPQKTVKPAFEMKPFLSSTLDVFTVPRFRWTAPILEIKGQPWQLYIKKDTNWIKTPFVMSKDSLYPRDQLLDVKWVFDAEYKLELDSDCVTSIYGLTNKAFSQTFKIRSEDSYSRLILTVEGLRSPAFAELLDKNDVPVRKVSIENNVADFKFLNPGTYYVRAVEDVNGNGKWDPGRFATRTQPEPVYYCPKEMSLRANWDVEETWEVHEMPLDKQKPKALIPKSNKP